MPTDDDDEEDDEAAGHEAGDVFELPGDVESLNPTT